MITAELEYKTIRWRRG